MKNSEENKPTAEELEIFVANELCDHEDESGKYYRGDTVVLIIKKYLEEHAQNETSYEKEELEKALRFVLEWGNEPEFTSPDDQTNYTFNELARMVAQYAQKENQWINIETVKPEIGQEVIIKRDLGDVIRHEVVIWDKEEERFIKANGITRWMPLPNPHPKTR